MTRMSQTQPTFFFRVNSVTQFGLHVSAHTCSLHSPVSSLACQFAATACTTGSRCHVTRREGVMRVVDRQAAVAVAR